MLGLPVNFLRLAGCSVGCKGCDTDYTVAERLTAVEIVERLQRLPKVGTVCVTGGEPTEHPLGPLVESLRADGYRVALATAGVREACRDGFEIDARHFDFVSVSPHFLDDRWKLRTGSQVNIVPGLNGLRLEDAVGIDLDQWQAGWVTPCWYGARNRMERVSECLAFVGRNPRWRIGIQAHKYWGVA